MLYCYFGRKYYRDKLIPYQENYFLGRSEDYWFDDTLVQELVTTVDKSTIGKDHILVSPVLGRRNLDYISGGCKTLIQMLFVPDVMYLCSYMGDNCAEGLQKVSSRVDVHLLVEHNFKFTSSQVMYFPQYDRCIIGYNQFNNFIWEHYDDYKKAFF